MQKSRDNEGEAYRDELDDEVLNRYLLDWERMCS